MVSLTDLEDRSYQTETAAVLFEEDDSYIVNMPVGGGKTETAIEALATSVDTEDEYGAIVLLPDRRIEDQWYERMTGYGLDDHVDIERNETVSTKPMDNTSTHFRSYDDGGSALRDRRDRIKDWERDQRDDKGGLFTGDNIVLSTYQLLDSDIDYDRVDGHALAQYDDIILDEATNLVAHDSAVGDAIDTAAYRLNDYFSGLFEELETAPEEPRWIGLTALVGDRTDAVTDELDAAVVRPSIEAVDAYRPDAQQVEPHLATDGPLLDLLMAIEERERTTSYALYNLLEEEGQDDVTLSSTALQQYAGRDDEVGGLAQKVFQYRVMQSRVQEGTYGSLEPYAEDIQSMLDQTGLNHQDDRIIAEAFEHGVPAGADPDRDAAKLENEDWQLEDWEMLFPTMKEAGIRNLHQQFDKQGHQSLVFVRHRDTAADLPNILPGETGVLTGETSDSDQRTLLDAYDDGDLDTIAMTYSIGAEGLDFGAADHVVLMGEPRSVEEHHNAVGRIRRGDGPKWEHAMINYSQNHSFRYEQYLDFIEQDNPRDTITPDPSEEALVRVEEILDV